MTTGEPKRSKIRKFVDEKLPFWFRYGHRQLWRMLAVMGFGLLWVYVLYRITLHFAVASPNILVELWTGVAAIWVAELVLLFIQQFIFRDNRMTWADYQLTEMELLEKAKAFENSHEYDHLEVWEARRIWPRRYRSVVVNTKKKQAFAVPDFVHTLSWWGVVKTTHKFDSIKEMKAEFKSQGIDYSRWGYDAARRDLDL